MGFGDPRCVLTSWDGRQSPTRPGSHPYLQLFLGLPYLLGPLVKLRPSQLLCSSMHLLVCRLANTPQATVPLLPPPVPVCLVNSYSSFSTQARCPAPLRLFLTFSGLYFLCLPRPSLLPPASLGCHVFALGPHNYLQLLASLGWGCDVSSCLLTLPLYWTSKRRAEPEHPLHTFFGPITS